MGMIPDVPSVETDAPTTTSFEAVKEDGARLSPAQRAELAPGRYLVFGDERVVALDQEVMHVGRGFAADVRVEDQTVSRRHAVLVAGAEGMRVLDDRSSNGTFVNGERVADAALRDGDVIVFGVVSALYAEVA
jgi:pSer/pThr/pTyr-binding forkhead associated (FHA) protein